MVPFARRSTTSLENGGGDVAWSLSCQPVDWPPVGASLEGATVGGVPVDCSRADGDLPHLGRDAPIDSVAKSMAQPCTSKANGSIPERTTATREFTGLTGDQRIEVGAVKIHL